MAEVLFKRRSNAAVRTQICDSFVSSHFFELYARFERVSNDVSVVFALKIYQTVTKILREKFLKFAESVCCIVMSLQALKLSLLSEFGNNILKAEEEEEEFKNLGVTSEGTTGGRWIGAASAALRAKSCKTFVCPQHKT